MSQISQLSWTGVSSWFFRWMELPPARSGRGCRSIVTSVLRYLRGEARQDKDDEDNICRLPATPRTCPGWGTSCCSSNRVHRPPDSRAPVSCHDCTLQCRATTAACCIGASCRDCTLLCRATTAHCSVGVSCHDYCTWLYSLAVFSSQNVHIKLRFSLARIALRVDVWLFVLYTDNWDIYIVL